ncbi:VWA domain-containing protein [Edaphobacillus lindanitolerans]|uniref:VWA domain containing CoxE-like protein n=1 Tax=Edaphobacillus lindanitolerans TaxID=550447 RepID=A0A1U7PRX7_9BACI|nr:VWA domain-containing protein [Edaphobacillus lindanitolerans]SIT88055.1 VWA domain containing CoxE-like protein [Edaphobacillus lindanitolerans]
MTIKDNLTVLNVDAFDQRRFREILGLSKGLQKLAGEAAMPLFEPLLGDIWASFYKMKPALLETVDERLGVNKMMMEIIMDDQAFASYRDLTRLNDLASAIGTLKTGEQTRQWLAEQMERDEGLRALNQKLQELAGQQRPQEEEADQEASEVMEEFNEKMQQTLLENRDSYREAMDRALREAREVGEGLKSLIGGMRAGDGDAEMKKVPLRDKLLLAEKMASMNQMKQIAEWAGRFKQAARKKQRPKQRHAAARQGVTTGIDIENLLPAELSLFTHPMTKIDFLRRFSERQTMQFEQQGPESLNRGPVVLCLDQSDSMSSLDNQAKGFALALLSIAKKQKRDFCLVLFSTRVQVFKYERGEIGAAEMIRLAETYLRGGTDFELALGEALGVISESRFKQADLVFVTDGEDRLTDPFLDRFTKEKKEKAFEVLSLLIGTKRETVESFTDRVIQVKDFDDEGSFVAFEV